jgi:hypothetical protein
MSFKKNKYEIIKQAVSKDLAIFLANSFVMQKQVYDTCRQLKYLSPFERMNGYYEEAGDMIPYTFCQYGNVSMETLLLKCQPLIEKVTKLNLYPAYSYTRFYKKGDELKKHKDRFSCEISTTMNLGGDNWPIYIKSTKNKTIEINLKPGDMLVYSGCDLEHWREKFKGQECIQVFLHYNDSATPGSQDNMFDGRPHLGLPFWFKKNKR